MMSERMGRQLLFVGRSQDKARRAIVLKGLRGTSRGKGTRLRHQVRKGDFSVALCSWDMFSDRAMSRQVKK